MFKKAMRAMMVGLVAMLGVEAEAHWFVVKGQCYWHSGECVRKDKEPSDPVPTDFPNTPLGEARLRPTSVEISCSDGTVTIITLSADSVELVAQRPIVQADLTKTTKGGITTSNAEWPVIVSDAHFLEDPSSCPNSSPRDGIVRAMSVTMNLYDCVDSDPTICPNNPSNQIPHSAWTATCTLPANFNFTNYPKRVPFRGARYDCSEISRCHEEVPGKCEPL